jgi:hypothetical protein
MGRRGAIAPDVGLWQINRWLPLIVLFVIAALPLIALGQTSRPDSDPWRARVVSTIEEIENDTITLKAIHTKLEKAGMPTEAASDQAYLEWLSRQSEDVSHNLVLLTNIQNKIDQHLVELWFQSHNPGPIPGIEIQLLIGEAPFVTDYYRKWLGQFSGTEADAMKAAIPANINAIILHTAYKRFWSSNTARHLRHPWSSITRRSFGS